MPRIEKPSDVNKIKSTKLTKRRLLKALSTAGAGTATLQAMTVDDVKAADSDQVTITMTCGRDIKQRVPADWYDFLIRARKVKRRLTDNWLSTNSHSGNKDGDNDVFGVWLDAGKGGSNPHVVVTIDENSNTKGETKGKIPERKNDVAVEVETAEREYETACDPECKDVGDIPGGLEVSVEDVSGKGTLGPQAFDYSQNRFVGTTAAHVASVDNTYPEENECGNELIGRNVYHCNRKIGEVDYIDHKHDVCLIAGDYVDWIPEIWNPANHSSRYPITDTATKDGVDFWINKDKQIQKLGRITCYTGGEIHARGTREDASTFSACADDWYDCVRWGNADDIGAGDSGSVAFGYHTESDNFYAVCQNSWRWYDYSTGQRDMRGRTTTMSNGGRFNHP